MYNFFRQFLFAVFSISFYRRKHIELYKSHEIFRANNEEAYEIIQQSAKEAMEDALDFLKSEGNIAVSFQNQSHYRQCKLLLFYNT